MDVNADIKYGIEGNRRVNYITLTNTSGETVVRSLDAGLTMIESVEGWTNLQSGFVMVTTPTSFPEHNLTSGVLTVAYTSSPTIYLRVRGRR
jgi:hypothetical protein